MDQIFFPTQYKKAILGKTKNTTIRIWDEVGKYKERKIYLAASYAGNSWGVKIKVKKILKTTIGELDKHGIPKISIATVRREGNLDDEVEIISFTVL